MFDNKFQVFLADTEESKIIHYELRYKVYCLEKGFEPAENFDDKMEIDEYDKQAVHFLVRDRTTGAWLATFRLVIGTPDQIPMRRIAPSLEGVSNDMGSVAELSRFSILNNYRRAEIKQARKFISEILLGLLRASKAYCERVNVEHWMFLCKRPVANILKRAGMTLQTIGSLCEYHGARYPFLLNFNTGFDSMPSLSPETYEMFSNDQAYYKYSSVLQKTGIGLAACAGSSSDEDQKTATQFINKKNVTPERHYAGHNLPSNQLCAA